MLLVFGCSKPPVKFKFTHLQSFPISAGTGEKPQSKVWVRDGAWRAVLPDCTGTYVWILRETIWEKELHISDSTNVKADVLPEGDLVHILLFDKENTQLVSLKYDRHNKKYAIWPERPEPVDIPLEKESETATIAIDGKGRMWVASDAETEIHVRWSDPPYSKWSSFQTAAEGIKPDDICAVTAFPDGKIGVFWSNQNSKRFGFRIHKNGDAPDSWGRDEVPASASALKIKKGMADDHINFAVSSDGTLYAAVKTSYDTEDYPLVALLVRQPDGEWDKLYTVDDEGSRPVVLLSEKYKRIFVVYSSYRDRQLVCKVSDMNKINFGERQVLIQGKLQKHSINNATSTKQIIDDEAVIVASEDGMAKSIKAECY